MSQRLNLKNLQIKYKIWLAFSLVTVILIVQGLQSLGNLQQISGAFNHVTQQSQPAFVAATQLESSLEGMVSGLSTFLLTREATHRDQLNNSLASSQQALDDLRALNIIQDSAPALATVDTIANQIKSLNEWQQTNLPMFLDDNRNILAIGFASESVNPISRDVLQLISQMLISEDDQELSDERRGIAKALNDVRYNWLNLMNEMRLYLAFKAPASLDNLTLFKQVVNSDFAKLSEFNEAELLTFEQADSYEQIIDKKQQFYTNLDRLIEIHGSEQWRQDAWKVRTELTPMLDKIKASIAKLIDLQSESNARVNGEVVAIVASGSQMFYVLVSIAIVIVVIIGWYLTRQITRPLNRSVEVANSIASGNLENVIKVDSGDETGQLLQALSTMQSDLKTRIDRDAQIAATNARIRQALDNVSANVMLADHEHNIIYVNDAANELFHNLQDHLAQDIDGFNADELVGSNIDRFHKDPAMQRGLLKDLNQRHQSHFVAGGRHIYFAANPVRAENGERLGTVVEWTDKTDEVESQMEIDSIVTAIRQGDLNQRVSTQGKSGFFVSISAGINQMVEEIAANMNDISSVMTALSQGDLTHNIDNRYVGTFHAVADSVNQTIEQLSAIVSEIRTSAHEVSSTSSEILDGNNSLSSRTEQQAAAIEQTASSMEELTGTVRQNADNAATANQLSNSARDTADKGGEVVDQAILAMGEIKESSEKIAEIINVIDEIAFQTNLLALNASVEAARAGEQGRGFAVVATEVRNLAQRAATSAKEIKDLIRDSVSKVNAGSVLVTQSGETLQEIMQGIRKVSDIVHEISAASEEQSTGINQVKQAITSIDDSTQQNAALAEQTSAASASLNEQSLTMIQRLQFFKLDAA